MSSAGGTGLRQAAEWGCVEVSVTTLAGQRGAIDFYKARGFSDDAVLLEKHLDSN